MEGTMDQTQTTTAQTTGCINVGDLLAQVKKDIAAYEARNLSQLKSDLDAFVKKKQSVVDDYTKKQPVQLSTWKGQNTQIAQIGANLKCMFPNGQWKTYIGDCVCPAYKDIADQTAKVNGRQNCALGTLETARNNAKTVADKAKADLDALTANAAGVDTALSANAKTITAIQTLLQGTDKAKAIFTFWFQLLPAHVALAPAGLPDDCLAWAKGEAPWELCTSIPAPDSKAPHPVPWLIDTKAYDHELDCAWTRYNEAREASAKANAAFAAAPDDLAAAVKTLNDTKAGRDDKILTCLGTKVSAKPCCDAVQTNGGGSTSAGATSTTTGGTSTTDGTPATTPAQALPVQAVGEAPHVDPSSGAAAPDQTSSHIS